MALKGEIKDIPVEQIFSLINNTKSTGKLSLENGKHEINIYFMNGVLVNAKGDKDPYSAMEFALGFDDGFFEFDKTENVTPCEKAEELKKIYADRVNIRNKWKEIRKAFPSENIVIKLLSTNKEEIELSGNEWKTISLVKQPIPVYEVFKQSPFGTFETFKILLSIFNKGLIGVSGEENPKDDDADDNSSANIVPVRNLGYWAMRNPISGIKAVEFYRRADDKKNLKEIAKEMGISLKEAKEIFDFLVKNDKLDKPRR